MGSGAVRGTSEPSSGMPDAEAEVSFTASSGSAASPRPWTLAVMRVGTPTSSSAAGTTSPTGTCTGSNAPAASRPPASSASSATAAAVRTVAVAAAGRRAGTGRARRQARPVAAPTPIGRRSTASTHSGGVVEGSAARSGKSDGTPGNAANGDVAADPTPTPGPSTQLIPPTTAFGR